MRIQHPFVERWVHIGGSAKRGTYAKVLKTRPWSSLAFQREPVSMRTDETVVHCGGECKMALPYGNQDGGSSKIKNSPTR